MGILENIFGIKQPDDYTVKDNRTGKEIPVRDAKELEKLARHVQSHPEEDDRPKPFFMRLTDRK